MNPRDFLQTAKDLLKSDKPAACRTAFNRSYYAAYNVGVDLLEKSGHKVSRTAKAHNKVTTYLNNCAIQELVEAQQKLVNLYSDRIKADYQLWPSHVEKINNAKLAVKRAEIVIQTFDSYSSASARQRIAKGINSYKHKIKSVSGTSPDS
jgi:hypothetical protein